MTSKEKILKYLDFKGLTAYQFQKKTGLSNGVLKSGKDFGVDKVKTIRDNYLDLSMDWLLFDEGEMIVSTETKPKKEKKSTDYENYKTFTEHNFVAVNNKVDNLSNDFAKFKEGFLELIEEKLEKAIKNKKV
ncbi:hypothetical protein CXF68_09135 [Tenacibaculum sp. Bg11-29]|uniref:hypothetical protein n=1 Tax=Tenacibaculum sp. Bg11-29 TaxID=2058306 RepID=UPI000C323C39|nr:hypothetical protein [Tenacibaculum sp. Bg11-29]PKH50839.1 hypothetical protein CXF68_09135 [Tenacibaculum sp. Bg11-29]